jgi:hypothetical protein
VEAVLRTIVCIFFANSLLVNCGWTTEQIPLTQAEASCGWIALFDGQTTFGWHTDQNWQVSSGTLQPKSSPSAPLVSTTEFADVELQLEFQAKRNSVAIVSLRTSHDPAYNPVQIQVGTVGAIDSSAALIGTGIPDKWHRLRVIIEGNTVSAEMNGKALGNRAVSSGNPLGPVSLQVSEGKVAFRNIRLKPLGMTPLFNGKDLAAWTEKNANKSRYEITANGEIRVLGGEGQLETKKSYDDFVLQLECYVNGEGINSGVFYRAISGKFFKIKGYESQIYNAVDPNAPEAPQKFGTGGIYLHQAARTQVSRDREWFNKTIAVSGRHVSVWVNGLQVSDWTDERGANENPRLGCRLEPGVICLQGHDPTTDVLFRNIRIAEISSRR